MVIILASVNFVQASGVVDCTFLGIKTSDRVSKTGPSPDGKPDAVFSLDMESFPASSKIVEISIHATKPSGVWNSGTKRSGAGFLGLADAKNPGELINKSASPISVDVGKTSQILLFAADDGKFSTKDRKYNVKVAFSDGTSRSADVRSESLAAPRESVGAGGVFPVRMTAILKGISNYDAVGSGKKLSSDGKGDGLFVLNVEAKDREITGIEIKNVDGTPSSVWDTLPGSGNGSIGVADVSEPGKLLNAKDGSVKIKVNNRQDLNLYVGDNGSIDAGKTNYKITVSFADGSISWCPAQKAETSSRDTATAAPVLPTSQVNFLCTWLGFASTDAVGPTPEIKPDGKADGVFGLDIEVSPKNFIVAMEIDSVDGPPRKWSTNARDPSVWGLALAYQTAPSALLNKPDGSLRIPIENRVQFYLYAADSGSLASASQQLRMIVHLADGSSYQQLIRRNVGTTYSVVPGVDESTKARGIVTCEFRGFIADLVNTSTKPGKDGYLDGTFILKLQIEEKIITKIEVKSEGSGVSWSSDGKPPAMFLGVALYPKIYVLVNEKAGLMNIPVTGRRTVYLYGADNGLLSDPKSRLVTTVTFSDKSFLSVEVIK